MNKKIIIIFAMFFITVLPLRALSAIFGKDTSNVRKKQKLENIH